MGNVKEEKKRKKRKVKGREVEMGKGISGLRSGEGREGEEEGSRE